ncbi:MAG: hypothetical protein EBT93_05485 [Alphaproteobacteria bacterium]|jgi:hypothetical protein|nr:hypothetical protein [Alphaproteobacteria bacterium]
MFATSVCAISANAGGLPDADSDSSEIDANEANSASPLNTSSSSGNEVPSTSATSSSAGATGSSNEGSEDGEGFVAIEDDPLIVDATAIMDDDGMGEVSVQWQMLSNDGGWMNLTGATQQSFTPRQIHVGHRLRVVITYVDGQGNLETLISPSSTKVKNVNDKPSGAPILLGNALEEDALVVDTSTISDEDGIGSYEVIWQRSSTRTEWQTFPNATSEVLRLGQSHVGFSYRAVITYLDNQGTREILISNPSETVANVDDPVEGEVMIVGKPLEGSMLSVTTSGVSDEDGIASLSVSWEASRDGRNWRAIDGSNYNQISLNQAHVGFQIRAKASVVDTFGVETLIYSQPSNTIKNVNNAPSGTINVRRVGS